MTFEDFLKNVASKIGPKNAFELARDSRFKALEQILIKKGVLTEEELDEAIDKELDQLAEKINKIPSSPSD